MNFHDGSYQAQNHSAIQQTPESNKGESQRVMQKLALAIRDLGDATTIIAIVPLLAPFETSISQGPRERLKRPPVDVDTVLDEIGITHLEGYFAQVTHREAPFAIGRSTSNDDEARSLHPLSVRT